MIRTLTAAVALGAMMATAGVALAQSAPGPYYGPAPAPAYNPNYAAPPGTQYAQPPAWTPGSYDGTHTSGGASRAYSYTGSQKTN